VTTVAQRRVPPGPTGLALLGTLWQLGRDRLGMMTSAANRYGDAVRLGPGSKALYFFNHPDAAKHVLTDNSHNYHKGIGLVHARRALGDGLLTSEGELWRKQRTVIQPVFQARRIAQQAGNVAQEAAGLIDRLHRYREGEPVDLVKEMTGFTLGVLGRTLMNADLAAFGAVGPAFEAMQDQAMFELSSMSMVPMWVPLPKQLRFRRARRYLQQVVDQLVAYREAHANGKEDDALSRLIQSTRAESDPRVGRQRMRDELVTLLLAGHETTASTLSWTFYLIDRNTWVRERLRAEALDVLGDRLPVYEDLHRLPYTSMVISEVMRLYPPVWMLSRIAQDVDEVLGYPVPAGADVLICPYTLHRHRDFWPEPERFDPERFSPANAGHARYAYLPFGAGPRFCVGNHLGLMEAVFVTAMAARELRLTTAPGYRVVAEPMLSLRIRGGLPMLVRSIS
jgi:enediyne biosynthesis protein E7